MKKILMTGLTVAAIFLSTSCGKSGGGSDASTYVPPYNPNGTNGYINNFQNRGYNPSYLGSCTYGSYNCGCISVDPCASYSGCGSQGQVYWVYPEQGQQYFQPFYYYPQSQSGLSVNFQYSNSNWGF